MMVIRVCDKFIDSDAGINMASKEGNAISKIYFFFSEDNSYPQTLFIMIEGTWQVLQDMERAQDLSLL